MGLPKYSTYSHWNELCVQHRAGFTRWCGPETLTLLCRHLPSHADREQLKFSHSRSKRGENEGVRPTPSYKSVEEPAVGSAPSAHVFVFEGALPVLITKELALFPRFSYEKCMSVLLQSGQHLCSRSDAAGSHSGSGPVAAFFSVAVTFCSHQVDKEFLSCCFMNEVCALKEHKN